MPQHTPGPWEVVVNSAGGVSVERERGAVERYSDIYSAGLRRDELNAAERLGDAAPQLLSACKAALETINNPAAYTLKELSEILASSIAAAEGTG